MKYRLINIEEFEQKTNSVNLISVLNELKQYEVVLSEEQTLAKFKDIWQDGFNSGYDETTYPPKNEKQDWNEFKLTL
jgi:hypothetical protein